MQNLIAQLRKLYLPSNSLSVQTLTQHLLGQRTLGIDLTSEDGFTRAMVIAFNKADDNEEAQHWTRLCLIANTLQSDFGFPAPAVSISGADGYRLWLSLESPTPLAQTQNFLELLLRKYIPDMDPGLHSVSAPVEVPPCLQPGTGKWAAFIHPGMGASFADESWLEMAPPVAGQIAFLKDLQSISAAQFQSALRTLQTSQDATPTENVPALSHVVTQDGLLLRDATLEDIVGFLHSKNIEPTFRHRFPK